MQVSAGLWHATQYGAVLCTGCHQCVATGQDVQLQLWSVSPLTVLETRVCMCACVSLA